MKTLTITDAKKNLGQWLLAAARGEDVGIISGSDIIALRKVEVESTDYAYREYGVTLKEMENLERNVEKRYQHLKRGGKLVTLTPAKLKKLLEEATHD
jgi:antitoxin (DNA-binding transcriptional repressor) of toxin-antitoxin stability system